MNTIDLGHLATDELIEKMTQLEKVDSENFQQMVLVLGLDPKFDFRYSNLCDTDLSDCNLCGYDFTGADLSGAHGINVKWDTSTIFENADFENSIFSHSARQKQLFASNPTWNSELESLSRQNWTHQILWYADNTKIRESEGLLKIMSIGYELYRNSKDASVKNNILYFSSRIHRELNINHRDFLINLLNSTSIHDSEFANVLNVLVSMYAEDHIVQNLLFSLLRKGPAKVRQLAYATLMNSKKYPNFKGYIDDAITTEEYSSVRKAYLEIRAKMLSDDCYLSVLSPSGKSVIDFNEVITSYKIRNMAKSIMRVERSGKNNFDIFGGPDQNISPYMGSDLEDETDYIFQTMSKIRRNILVMIKAGVPLKIEGGDNAK